MPNNITMGLDWVYSMLNKENATQIAFSEEQKQWALKALAAAIEAQPKIRHYHNGEFHDVSHNGYIAQINNSKGMTIVFDDGTIQNYDDQTIVKF